MDHLDHLFAGVLRGAIDRPRTRNVHLPPGPRLPRRFAREDVVGGDRNQTGAADLRRHRDVAGTVLVQFERQFSARLTLIDLRHRRAVDDEIGRDFERLRRKRRVVRNVPLGQVRNHKLMLRQLFLERTPQHAFSTGNQDLHGTIISNTTRSVGPVVTHRLSDEASIRG